MIASNFLIVSYPSYNKIIHSTYLLASNLEITQSYTVKPSVHPRNDQDQFNFVRDWTKGIDVLGILYVY